ncbi:hypothetical protein GEMRC1_009244 [Eukaryota sp. GEM-RC1]
MKLHNDFFSQFGQCLTAQQQLCIKNSAPSLKLDYHLSHLSFWGRISGLKQDYLVCQGHKDLFSPVFFFSVDGIQWAELPAFSQEVLNNVRLLRQPFTGDPTFVYKDDGEDESCISFSEALRLSAVVHDIAHDTTSINNSVVRNKLFEGVPSHLASKISSYLHFRPQTAQTPEEIAEKGLDLVFDCLPPITNDVPKGCWTLNYSEVEGEVVLRSLLWLGYVFGHSLEDGDYYDGYFGNGVRNNDILFMLR